MQRTADTTPHPLPNLQVSDEALLTVVSALYQELHHSPPDPDALSLHSHLERDLGFDSLARVELLQRLERSFEVDLPDETLGKAETLADLLSALTSAPFRHSPSRPGPAATVMKPIEAPPQSLGTPTTATTRLNFMPANQPSWTTRQRVPGSSEGTAENRGDDQQDDPDEDGEGQMACMRFHGNFPVVAAVLRTWSLATAQSTLRSASGVA